MAHYSLTPEGRGFDTALSFFTHGPDYYTHKKVVECNSKLSDVEPPTNAVGHDAGVLSRLRQDEGSLA